MIQGVNVGGTSAGVAAGGTGTEEDQERAEMVSNRAADKENNKPYNVQISSNVEQSDGIRKEIPQIMENGNQARSKYFPTSGGPGPG